MADVAAVAARLLTRILSAPVRARLLSIDPVEVEAVRALLFVIALHDFGKATPAFQAKVEWARGTLPSRGLDLNANVDDRHHGDIGLFFLETELSALGASADTALSLARAVTAHHGHFPTNACGRRKPGRRERGASPTWDQARSGIIMVLRELFEVERMPSLPAVDHGVVMLLAGLTSIADWIGSMAEVFSYEPPHTTLAEYWPVALERADRAIERVGLRAPYSSAALTFSELFPSFDAWPLHEVAESVAGELASPSLIIIEAPMGEGKTEAALLLAEAAASRLGQAGFFIGLPTQATANQMFGRVEVFLRRNRPDTATSLLLAHGEAELVERFQRLVLAGIYDPGAGGAVRAERWFVSRKRALLAEVAVGTIDQALLAVMRVPHAFVRLFGLAGKVVILDEVHAYDTYTGTLLDRLIEWLASIGCTVILLSATLPALRRAQLLGAYQGGARHPHVEIEAMRYPRISVVNAGEAVARSFRCRRPSMTVELLRYPDDCQRVAAEVVQAARSGGCIGWICNSVARAQAAYQAVRALAPDLRDRLLIHARLLPDDRQQRERQLECWLGPPSESRSRPHQCVVVGTQVLEQSLDVDFDLLVTDLAPIDLLLQRAGRLHRHRRDDRAIPHRTPRLIVVGPATAATEAGLKAVAAVYHEEPLRRTLAALEGRSSIVIPDEIEGLVELVYAAIDAMPEGPCHDAYAQRDDREREDQIWAGQQLVPRPTVEDPFGNLRSDIVDAEDPSVHRDLRPLTRLGPTSVEVVCLERRGGEVFVGDGGAGALDLSIEPGRSLTARLVRRSISISRREVVEELLRDSNASPSGWQRTAVLRYRRVVVFEEGHAVVGGVRLTLDPELGIVFGGAR